LWRLPYESPMFGDWPTAENSSEIVIIFTTTWLRVTTHVGLWFALSLQNSWGIVRYKHDIISMRSARKPMPYILLKWPVTTEANVGGIAGENAYPELALCGRTVFCS
jgi:hypothetical protein